MNPETVVVLMLMARWWGLRAVLLGREGEPVLFRIEGRPGVLQAPVAGLVWGRAR